MTDVLNPDAGDDEDLIINLEAPADPPEEQPDAGTPAPAESAAPAPVNTDPAEGLEDIQRQLVESRQREAQARSEASQHASRAQAAEVNSLSANEQLIGGQIEAHAKQVESIQGAIERAMAEGDFKAAAKLTTDLGEVQADAAILEREKEAWAAHRERLARQPAAQPQQQQPADPIEHAISSQFAPPTQAFLRKHRDLFHPNGSLKAKALAAHEAALEEGLTGDTPAYFTRIEEILGTAPAPRRAPDAPSRPASRGAPTIAAPVARSAAPQAGQVNGNSFRMTPKMRQLAAEQGVSDVEWAREYVRAVKDGTMQPIN